MDKPNNRTRLLRLFQLLERQSSPEQPLHMNKIKEILQAEGYVAERKALYVDFEALRSVGYPVKLRGGTEGGWYLESRPFSRAELRLLSDSVQASHVLPESASRRLIEKLELLAGPLPEAGKTVFLEGRVKTGNEAVLDSIETIRDALQAGKTLSFQYLHYDENGKLVLRREGKRYVTSPRALLCMNEHYYLVAEDHLHGALRHYRVDKLKSPQILSLPARPAPADFAPAPYAKRHFSMFGGREAEVELRADASLVGLLRERFGESASFTREGSAILLHTKLEISPQFYGWLFGLAGGVELRAPYWAVGQYRESLQKTLDQHSGFGT